MHKTKPAAPKPAAVDKPNPQPKASAPVDRDPWLLVVDAVDTDQTAAVVVLSTETDARRVAALLDTLGHQPHIFRLSDGR